MEPPEAACIAVAGPVSQNKVNMTNRNWVVDGSEVHWSTIDTRRDIICSCEWSKPNVELRMKMRLNSK